MKTMFVVAGTLLAVGVSGCVAHVGAGGAGVGVGVGVDAGPDVAYYDDYYGPYYDGYWGPDGDFYYYSDAQRVHVVHDRDHHFRREAGNGFHRVDAHHARQEERQEERHDNH